MIDIGICCGKNYEKFLPILINSIEKCFSNKNDINFIFGINPQINYDYDLLNKYTKNIVIVKNKITNSSLSHSFLLDELFKQFNNEYGILLDLDIILCYKNIDLWMKDILKDNILIGLKRHPNEIYNSNHINGPSILGLFFKTKEIKKLNFSFKPLISEMYLNKNKFEYYNNLFNFSSYILFNQKSFNNINQLSHKIIQGAIIGEINNGFDLVNLDKKCKRVLFDTSSELLVKLNIENKIYKIIDDIHNDYKFKYDNKDYEVGGDKYYYNKKLFCIHLGGGSERSKLALKKWKLFYEKYFSL